MCTLFAIVSRIANCASSVSGGFAEVAHGELRLEESKVIEAVAGTEGGGVYLRSSSSTLVAVSSSFTFCKSGIDFGGGSSSGGAYSNQQGAKYGTGAAIFAARAASGIIIRDVNISECSSPVDAGISLIIAAKLDVARLQLTPPCLQPNLPTIFIAERYGNTIMAQAHLAAATLANVRGLLFHAPDCPAAAGATPVVPDIFTLPTCSGGWKLLDESVPPTRTSQYVQSDSPPPQPLCGQLAVCTDVPIRAASSPRPLRGYDADSTQVNGFTINDDVQQPPPGTIATTPVCSCVFPNKLIPSTDIPASTTPFVLGCDSPRLIDGVGVAPLRVSSVFLDLEKPNNGSRTLTLRTAGTAAGTSTWQVDQSTVPAWLSLSQKNGTFVGNTEAPILTLTAFTAGIAERDEPYEALLKLQTESDLDVDYIVPVLLLVNTESSVQTSSWGKVSPAQDCSDPSQRQGVSVGANGAATLSGALAGQELVVSFTACDLDALPVAKQAPDTRPFSALVLRASGGAISAEMRYNAFGVYDIIVMPPTVGAYTLKVQLGGMNVSAGELYFTAHCPVGLAELPNGACGCPAGLEVQADGECALCSAGSFKAAAGNDIGCTNCPAGTVAPGQGSTACLPCPAGQFAVSIASTQCSVCPEGTSSYAGNASCEICASEFYKEDAADECEPCPKEATCPAGTTVTSMITNYGYWRLTDEATTFYKCTKDDGESPCVGGDAAACFHGHEGLECMVNLFPFTFHTFPQSAFFVHTRIPWHHMCIFTTTLILPCRCAPTACTIFPTGDVRSAQTQWCPRLRSLLSSPGR